MHAAYLVKSLPEFPRISLSSFVSITLPNPFSENNLLTKLLIYPLLYLLHTLTQVTFSIRLSLIAPTYRNLSTVNQKDSLYLYRIKCVPVLLQWNYPILPTQLCEICSIFPFFMVRETEWGSLRLSSPRLHGRWVASQVSDSKLLNSGP